MFLLQTNEYFRFNRLLNTYIFIYIKIDISLCLRYTHRRTSISLINVDDSDAHSDQKGTAMDLQG